jgi:5-methylcytosine-specific restriction endonuclease McrA
MKMIECFNSPTHAIKSEALFEKIKELVSRERRIGVEILECLYEIEKRKAYAQLKYDGLFSYCVKELGFTEAQAYQRIQAMRAMNEIPELKPMIETGSLSVTSVSQIQSHFKKEKKQGKPIPSKNQKLHLFKSLENLSTKTVEKKLGEIRGEPETKKLIFEMDAELEALWEKVKNLSAHQTQGDAAKILKILTQTWLLKKDLGKCEKQTQTNSRRASSWLTQKQDVKTTRSIPTAIKRQIWKRDLGKCQNCQTKYALEIDHIQPHAKNGSNAAENLRLLCRSCNQAKAIQDYGIYKILNHIQKFG